MYAGCRILYEIRFNTKAHRFAVLQPGAPRVVAGLFLSCTVLVPNLFETTHGQTAFYKAAPSLLSKKVVLVPLMYYSST